MQYILLVYIQVGYPFACLSNNLRSQQSLSCHADGFVAATRWKGSSSWAAAAASSL
jgi:hypothetical protein